MASSATGSPRRGANLWPAHDRGSPRKGHAKKPSSFTWEIAGSDYVRHISFKKLRADEKVGFGLGGKGQRCEVVHVAGNTQADWRGVKKGYKVTAVNGQNVTDITVTPALRDALASGKDFTIDMTVPNKPDWPENGEEGGADAPGDAGPPDEPAEKKEEPEKPIDEYENQPKDAEEDDRPIVEKEVEEPIQMLADDDAGDLWPSADPDNDYTPQRTYAPVKVAAAPPQPVAAQPVVRAAAAPVQAKPAPVQYVNVDPETASKEQLEAMERQKAYEVEQLRKQDADLRALISEKERQLKQSHERAVLEELKALRKSAKALKDRMRKALEELERIRALLRAKLLALERDMANLKDGAAARDAKLSALEDQVKSMQAKFGAK